MTLEERKLWIRIEQFQFDKPNTSLTFTRRLANENGWNLKYAERVVQEYKKFLFMCCISKNPVTPSDPVDQAWHLHLTYTKSYWVDMCENVLQKKIHHNPTEGGKSEGVKFNDWYTKTKQLYFDKLRQIPPSDIWQDNDTRFSDIDFERVNKAKNWVIQKPNFKKLFQLAGIVLLGIGSIYAEGVDWGSILFWCVIIFLFILLLVLLFGGNNRRGGGSSGSSGCSTSGGWFIFGGCGSSDSGCGSSGCSGCGGGGCGGGGCGS